MTAKPLRAIAVVQLAAWSRVAVREKHAVAIRAYANVVTAPARVACRLPVSQASPRPVSQAVHAAIRARQRNPNPAARAIARTKLGSRKAIKGFCC